MVFQQNLLEKAYFIAKMSGLTIVRPASSDFWKAPLGSKAFYCFVATGTLRFEDSDGGIL